MAWQDLANNQMVSYFDASTSGIPLLSGQSHFTTLPAANQCMTKADMQAKYNLLASNLTTYASNQLVPKSNWTTAVFYGVSLDTTNKGGFGNSAKYASYIHTNYYDSSLGSLVSFLSNDSRFVNLYASSSPIVVGTTIYSDNAGSLYVNEGEDGWHQEQGGTNPLIYYINALSQVSSIYTSVYEVSYTPPTTPLNFTALKSILGGASRYITFTWDPSTDNDMLHHYNLYCRYFTGATTVVRIIHIVPAVVPSIGNYAAPRDNNTPSGYPAAKNAIRISNSYFSDFNGVSYAIWYVRAVDISGNETAASNEINLPANTWATPSPSALGQTSRNWSAMCSAPNGDVYAAVSLGDIYKQSLGSGDFVATGQNSRNWSAMCSAPNGDIYAADGSSNTADIYKQASGTSTFVSQGQFSVFVNTFIRGLTATSNGDIYASNSTGFFNPTGNIYKRTGGLNNFVSTGQTPLSYGGMVTGSNGDVYTAAMNQTGDFGTLFVKPAASSTFSGFIKNGGGVTTQGGKFSIATNNDMWGFKPGGDVYKLEFEQLPYPVFQPLGQTIRNWSATCVRTTSTGYNVYFAVSGGDIYRYSYVN